MHRCFLGRLVAHGTGLVACHPPFTHPPFTRERFLSAACKTCKVLPVGRNRLIFLATIATTAVGGKIRHSESAIYRYSIVVWTSCSLLTWQPTRGIALRSKRSSILPKCNRLPTGPRGSLTPALYLELTGLIPRVPGMGSSAWG